MKTTKMLTVLVVAFGLLACSSQLGNFHKNHNRQMSGKFHNFAVYVRMQSEIANVLI